MEFGDNNGNGKLDVSDVDLMEFLVGYNDDSDERGLPQPHQQQQQQQQQQYQEISYSNNNANAFPPSGAQPPATNFNVTWTVQLGHAASGVTTVRTRICSTGINLLYTEYRIYGPQFCPTNEN